MSSSAGLLLLRAAAALDDAALGPGPTGAPASPEPDELAELEDCLGPAAAPASPELDACPGPAAAPASPELAGCPGPTGAPASPELDDLAAEDEDEVGCSNGSSLFFAFADLAESPARSSRSLLFLR